MTEELTIQTPTFTKHPDPLGFVLNSANKFNKPTKITIFVFGGWVRDMLRNKNPEDMEDLDLYIASKLVAKEYINSLEAFEFITARNKKPVDSRYAVEKIEIELKGGQRIKMDIVTSRSIKAGIESCDFCDFTCNNLTIDVNGKIGTRVPPPKSMGKISQVQWITKCISDAIQGKLVWMIDPSFIHQKGSPKYVSYVFKMRSRLEKMLSKGFVDTGESLTSFRLGYILCHRDIGSGKEISDSCSICFDNYDCNKSKYSVLLECGHDFHYDCINGWVEKDQQKKDSCPICRAKIVYLVRE